MGYNIEMQVSALLFLIIFAIIFFIKVRRWSPDNKAFAKLLIACLCLVVSDIICPIALSLTSVPVFIKILTGKFFLVFLFFCIMYLVEYTFSLTYNNSEPVAFTSKIRVFIYRHSSLIALVLAVFVIILPLTYNNQNGNSYIYGAAQYLAYGVGTICAIIIPVYTLRNRNAIPYKKQIPLYAFVVIVGLATAIQLYKQNLLLTSTALVTVIAMLYFTLQNPDITLLEEKNQKENALVKEMIAALADSVEAKDYYTKGHSSRVADYSVLIAQKAGFSEEFITELHYMAMLHDVGKIGVPDEIINKTDRLTDEEFEIIKQHPLIGGRMLQKINSIPRLYLCAKYHHERYDGKGYPDGLKGDDIPLEARIVGVADAYDAMTSTRSYRSSMPLNKVREELIKGRGTQFDPKYLDIMLELIDNNNELQINS